ncbi:hypothetical protein L208DRAFT_1547145 [Tricholoma matsutake]|nr:hypothetical protein L208DRAFT_1547145 [Tricholoma matsutake 945]
MNPFPQDRSVLILDNCAIHKSELLHEVVEAQEVFCYSSQLTLQTSIQLRRALVLSRHGLEEIGDA